MNQIHTSYKVSKKLKDFLKESAPEPMERTFYCECCWDGFNSNQDNFKEAK